ncbi:L-aspartate oxidase [Aciduricibacillus chroicocephali]|uniref:L-aspartate oxidase n=1 Tax=Aciduricibacillus chroicocephali TaxID=3054939 RepID=A0ABY9KTS8_9BACI|nr:L-aspartate oxidase [Bacillaceae bacterium 44XB]
MNDRIIIIGSGIAALAAADILCKTKNVIIFTKSQVSDGNSVLAQGGIAAAIDKQDSWQEHFEDSLTAACMHADSATLELLVKNGPACIKRLIAKGMSFDKDASGQPDLAREGAHGKRRILHSGGDATGRKLMELFINELKDSPNITFHENELAIELIVGDEGRCCGVYTRNDADRLIAHEADAVILATGGTGSLYSCTSNHPNCTGDGIAMAYRAGAEIADMEFIQFHPTILHHDGESLGLVSEAVRGEGAILKNELGEAFMENVHPLRDLAPRDVVARALHMQYQNGHKVMLDISPVRHFSKRFPTITEMCSNNGVDVEQSSIPVMPGAHFLMGGIRVNPYGETSLPGLFAIGECACTGVHGANRLASNSLLEGLVFGSLTAGRLLDHKHFEATVQSNLPNRKEPYNDPKLPEIEEIQQNMMHYAGLVRDESGLKKLIAWLTQHDFLSLDLRRCSREAAEKINMLTTAWLIATSALERTESRGSHFRADFPVSSIDWQGKRIIHEISEKVSATAI